MLEGSTIAPVETLGVTVANGCGDFALDCSGKGQKDRHQLGTQDSI